MQEFLYPSRKTKRLQHGRQDLFWFIPYSLRFYYCFEPYGLFTPHEKIFDSTGFNDVIKRTKFRAL